MFAELVLTYALASTIPLYLHESQTPLEFTAQLDVRGGDSLYYRIAPFLRGSHEDPVGGVGAEAELGVSTPFGRIGWYHRSEHNVDIAGPSIRIDAVQWRIPL